MYDNRFDLTKTSIYILGIDCDMNKENLITLIDKLEKDIESVELEKLTLKDKFFMLSELERRLSIKRGLSFDFDHK